MTWNIALVVDPSTPPMSWHHFCRVTEPYAIALDGFVNEGPKFEQRRAVVSVTGGRFCLDDFGERPAFVNLLQKQGQSPEEAKRCGDRIRDGGRETFETLSKQAGEAFVTEAEKLGVICNLQDEGPRANFNHHEGVSRLETRATCGQVLLAIRMGLQRNVRPTDPGLRERLRRGCLSFVVLAQKRAPRPSRPQPTAQSTRCARGLA